MLSGHTEGTARSTYNNLSKKNVAKELVKEYDNHVNFGKGGYFPQKHL